MKQSSKITEIIDMLKASGFAPVFVRSNDPKSEDHVITFEGHPSVSVQINPRSSSMCVVKKDGRAFVFFDCVKNNPSKILSDVKIATS